MERLNFEIQETRQSSGSRLSVIGDLDLASAPLLEARLEQLRIEGRSVRLDLSELAFIDSSGIHVLFRAFREASTDGWRFQIEPGVAPPAMRLLKLVNLDALIEAGR